MKISTNVWKTLFFLSLGWQFYASCAQQENKPVVAAKPEMLATTTAPSNCPIDSISDGKGTTNTGLYISQRITMSGGNLLNPTVNKFIMPKCELSEMLQYANGADSVIAQLAINPGLNGAKDTVDIYFQVFNNLGQIRYFDFNDPCPPCNGQSQAKK
jgi:hypothetical protein